ncbi:MAG: hypothetical protein ACRD43_07360, partial [Pyrinomonadaceae bacterium]
MQSLTGLSAKPAAIKENVESERPMASAQPVEDRTIDRDLSLIEFYSRVLEEAIDRSQPLLERIKFVAIVSSLLDEFYMIRMAALKTKAEKEADDIADPPAAARLMDISRKRLLEILGVQY